MGIPAVLVIFVGFLSLGASFILQLLVSLSLPYIKGIYFLDVDLSTGTTATQKLVFGIWSNCVKDLVNNTYQCVPNGLGYQQPYFAEVVRQAFVNKLPYALVVQPVAAGFTGLAAGAAFLHLCSNTFLWPLSAIWASFLTMAALVIELVLFVLARNKFRDAQSDGTTQNINPVPISSNLGPAIWMQVAALPPCFFGFLMLAIGWWMKRSRDTYRDDYVDAPPRASYYEKNDEDYYHQRAPSRASRRSRAAYDDYYGQEDPRVYGNVGRRESLRSAAREESYYYDERPPRRSYGGDGYDSRTS
ncbi:hypothetical protein IE53DRAFT_33489, partial [Violaceomyces palustris]